MTFMIPSNDLDFVAFAQRSGAIVAANEKCIKDVLSFAFAFHLHSVMLSPLSGCYVATIVRGNDIEYQAQPGVYHA